MAVPIPSALNPGSPVGSPSGQALLAPVSQSPLDPRSSAFVHSSVPFGAKKLKSSELLWDNARDVKVLCLVDRARGFSAAGEFFTKLVYAHAQQSEVDIGKTKTCKPASSEPAWKATFFFTVTNVSDLASVRLEVRTKTNKSKGVVELPTLSATSLVQEGWFPLRRTGKKSADKYFDEGAELHVRLVVADAATKETYPLAQYQREQNPGHLFSYDQHLAQLKTGDVLLFCGYGLLPAYVAAHSGHNYSSVGLVVELTHKYTEELELYVFEVTRNLEEMVDAFSDVVRVGCTLLPLRERLHRYHGSSIVWLPLREPIPEAQQDKMFATLWNLHREATLPVDRIQHVDVSLLPTADFLRFLHDRFAFSPKTPDKYAELYSPAVVASLLAVAGVLSGSQLDFHGGLFPSSLLSLSVFHPPTTLRCLQRDRSSSFNQSGSVSSPAVAASSSSSSSSASLPSSPIARTSSSAASSSASPAGERSGRAVRKPLVRQPTVDADTRPSAIIKPLPAKNLIRVRILALDRVCHGAAPNVAMLLGFAKREVCPFHTTKESSPALEAVQHDRQLLKLAIAPNDRSPTWSGAVFDAPITDVDPIVIRLIDERGANDHLLGEVHIDHLNVALDRHEQWYPLRPKKHATRDEVMGRILLSFTDVSAQGVAAGEDGPFVKKPNGSGFLPSSAFLSSPASSSSSSSTSSSTTTVKKPCYDLELHLIQGKDLPNRELFGTSDPYAVILCRSTGESFKSRTVNACLNPEWGQSFRFRIPSTKSAADMEFKVDVWDKDPISDRHMGTLMLSSALIRETVTGTWFPLHTRRGQVAGEIQLGWKVVPHHADPDADYHRLQVTVVSADNIAMNKFGAYVTLWLKGWNITTFQTFPDRDTLSPKWNMEFFFTMDGAAQPLESILQGELWTATGAFSAPKYLGSLPDLRVVDLPLDADIERDFAVVSLPKKCKPKHLVPAKGTVRLKMRRTVGRRWPPNNSALAIHIRFFDINEDGVITEEEIRVASEQMGFSPFISWVLSKVVLPLMPTDLFSAMSGVRHKDAKLFRLQDGTFDEEQFERWFHESAHDPAEGLSFWDIVKASWKIDPTPAGLLAGLGELGFVYLLKAKNSRLSKQDLEDFISGDLFVRLTAARRRESNLGFYANDVAAPVFH